MSAEGEQFLVDGRPVSDLKVVELRKELEIRSLPKSGNKKELVDRLLNFLREEQEELIKQKQIPQEEINQENKQSSPSATPSALPDMVSQYLVQQQIQLEVARRDADKVRASSSYDSIPTEMVQQTEQQLTGVEVAEKCQSMLQEQERDLNEFVPEEPSGSGQEHLQSTELHSHNQQTEAIEEVVQDDSQQEVNSDDENGESEVDDKAQRSEESSVTEEGYADIGGDDEDTTPAAGESSIQVGEAKPQFDAEESVESNMIEHSEPQIIEELSQQSFTNDNVEAENIAEFVPDEPEHKKSKIENDDNSVERSVNVGESDVEVGSQKGNSDNEYDEDEHENIDDSGKRRREVNEVSFEETKGIDNDEKEGLDKKEGEFAPQTIVVTAPQQISSTLDRRRISSTLTGVEMLSSSKPPIEIQQEYEEITPEGFIRKRAASPARNYPSRWIHIRGLKRPYTQRALLDLLGKFGTVNEDDFWIDSIKSNCIVTYDTVEQAEFARERLHNVIWPTASTEALCVEFSTEEKLKRRQSEEQNGSNSRLRLSDTLQPLPETGGRGGGGLGGLTIVVDNRCPISPSVAQVHIQHEKEQQKAAEIRKRKAEELEQSQEKLNQIFKKTKTQPSLYYLPLSDDEAAKRQANKKQSSSKNNSSTRDRDREHRRDNENCHDSHHRSSHYSYHRGSGNNDRRRTTATTSNRR